MNTKKPGAPSWPNLSQVKQRQPENLLKSKSGVKLQIALPPAARVLQAKTLFPARIAGQTATGPKAPPVYRPQSAPKVLQQKSAIIQRQVSVNPVNRPIAPPVYRPTAARIVQLKKTVASAQTVRLPERPIHPIALPTVLQPKTPGKSIELPRPSASTLLTGGLQRLPNGQNRQPAGTNASAGINGTKYPGQQFSTPAAVGNRRFPIQRVTVRYRENRGLDAWAYNRPTSWIGTRRNVYPHTSIYYTRRQTHSGARPQDPVEVSYTFTSFHYSTDARTHYYYDETTPNHWERGGGGYYPAAADHAADDLMDIIGGTLDRYGTAARARRLQRAAAAAQARQAQQAQQAPVGGAGAPPAARAVAGAPAGGAPAGGPPAGGAPPGGAPAAGAAAGAT